jgi:hypothetical protein
MTDTPKSPKPLPRDFRTGISVGVLGLSILGITLLNIWGDDENGIHTTTVEGCLWIIFAILLGGGIVILAPTVLSALPWGRK